MNTVTLAEYIKHLEKAVANLYKDYSGSEFERGQIWQLELVIERLKEIASHNP